MKNLLPKEQQDAYGEFYNAARQNNILDEKTTILLHLASAMAFACYP
jgi:hypothetical protein